MVSASLNDESYSEIQPQSTGGKRKKKAKKNKKLEVADYEEDDLDLVMNNVSAMAQIKEEEDQNLNEAKYANQSVDLEHLQRLTKSKE